MVLNSLILFDYILHIYQGNVFIFNFITKHYNVIYIAVALVEYLCIYISQSLNCVHILLIYIKLFSVFKY